LFLISNSEVNFSKLFLVINFPIIKPIAENITAITRYKKKVCHCKFLLVYKSKIFIFAEITGAQKLKTELLTTI